MIPGVSYDDIMPPGGIHFFSYLGCEHGTFVSGIIQIEVTLYKILCALLAANCKSQNGEEDKVRKC